MREYHTNKLHLKFDYETIERDFDIYQIKQNAEGKKYISQEERSRTSGRGNDISGSLRK